MSGAFTGALTATKNEIERLCSYITSDTSIANYLGVSAERVAHVRKRMPPRPAFGVAVSKPPIGFDAMAEADVRMSSDSLRDAMQRLFDREAKRVGCPAAFARDHLLDGPRAAISRHLQKDIANV